MKLILSFICCLCLVGPVYAQDSASETKNAVVASYLEAAKGYTSIYSGWEEPRYRVKTTNHPYLDTDAFRSGTLYMNGCVYPDVMMRLNNEKEALVVLSPNEKAVIVIPKERFEAATIDSLFITYQKPYSADGRILPEGYYVRIYDGTNKVWKREVAFLVSEIQQLKLIYSFQRQTKIYIWMDGVYHPVSTKRAVLKLFASHKKELKKMLKQTGVNYKDNPEKAVVAITSHYDELNK